MNNSLRVLVTGAGSVYGLGIIKALQASVLPMEIFAVDLNPYSLGLFIADKCFIAPQAASEESYYNFIEKLCTNYQIKAIFIGSGTELSFYAKKRKMLENSTGAKVFVSSPPVVKICRDKWLTMCYLSRFGFPIPNTIRYPEDLEQLPSFIKRTGFPVIVKPRIGRGSEGVALTRNQQQLRKQLKGRKNLILQEYLADEEQEYTVGVCLDQMGRVISKIALKRQLRDGVSIAAVSENYHDIADYCAKVAGTLQAYGAMNVQLRLRDGKPVIFEINPRFSSSTSMRLLLGINEPESLIRAEVLGQEVIPGRAETGLVLRQYTDYFFPLDRLTVSTGDQEHPLTHLPTS